MGAGTTSDRGTGRDPKDVQNRRCFLILGVLLVAVVTSTQGWWTPSQHTGVVWIVLAHWLAHHWWNSVKPRPWITDSMLGVGMGLVVGNMAEYWGSLP